MKYADAANSAFPLEPAARAPIAHDAIHRLYDSSRWGPNTNPNVPPIGGAARNYDAAKFAAVHAEAVRAMLDAGYNHRLRCAGSLDNSLPQELFDRSTPPPGATIDAQGKGERGNGKVLISAAAELLASFQAQGAISETPNVNPVIPADLLARVKTVDPEPFLVSGMIAKVGTRLPVAIRDGKGQAARVEMLFTREFLADLKAQVPVVQHPEHLDHQRGAFARRANVSYMLAAELSADGNELWGKAWIPASQADLINEVKAGLAAKLPPAWSVEGPATLIRAGDDWVAKPGSAKLLSIDWVETGRPGVPGAGPAEIVSAQLNAKGKVERGNGQVENPDFAISTPSLRPSPNPSKEDLMEQPTRGDIIASLTLDELKAGRKDLVDAIVSAQDTGKQLDALKAERDALKTKVEGFEKATITAQVTAKKTELLSTIADENVRKVAEKMLTGETVADVTAQWPGIQETVKPLIKAMPALDGVQGDKTGKPPKGLTV